MSDQPQAGFSKDADPPQSDRSPVDGTGSLFSHLAALFLLWGMAWLWFQPLLMAPEPRVDERTYLRAAAAVQDGLSPYDVPGYQYTPAFAVLTSWLVDLCGSSFLFVLRGVCLFGSCLAAWVSLGLVGWARRYRFLAAALVVGFSPLVNDALWTGNVTPLVVGGLLLGLALVSRFPLTSGGLIGFLDVVKPMGVPVPVLFVAWAWRRPGRGWAWLASGSLAVVGSLTLLLGWQHLPRMLERAGGEPFRLGNISWHRVFYLLDLDLSPAFLFAVVVAVALFVVRRRSLGAAEVLVLAASTSLLALPLNNPSSFLLSLPAQAMALDRAWSRRDPIRGRWAYYELVLVGALVLSPHGSRGILAAGQLAPLPLALVTAIPLLAVALLTGYALSQHGQRATTTERG